MIMETHNCKGTRLWVRMIAHNTTQHNTNLSNRGNAVATGLPLIILPYYYTSPLPSGELAPLIYLVRH